MLRWQNLLLIRARRDKGIVASAHSGFVTGPTGTWYGRLGTVDGLEDVLPISFLAR